MGTPMAANLIAGGHEVSLSSRSGVPQSLLDGGGVACNSGKEVAERADVIFLMVPDTPHVEAALFHEGGIAAGLSAGKIVVDMSSISPIATKGFAERVNALGCQYLDAPVSGGEVGARNATLSIMVGGDEKAVERVRPLLEVMGKTIVRQGGPGAGQHAKMVNQTLIAGGMIGVCEALLYAYKAGLDLETVLESVAPGAAGSWSLTNYAPRMLKGDFEPGFVVEHFVKDMGIALGEAKRMKLSLPGLALAEQLYVALTAQGRGRKGTQSLILALAALSDVDWQGRTTTDAAP